jgi:hypothetical protein
MRMMRKRPALVPASDRRVPVAITKGEQTVHGVMHWENSPHGTVTDDQGLSYYAATLIHNGWTITEITLAGGTFADAHG